MGTHEAVVTPDPYMTLWTASPKAKAVPAGHEIVETAGPTTESLASVVASDTDPAGKQITKIIENEYPLGQRRLEHAEVLHVCAPIVHTLLLEMTQLSRAWVSIKNREKPYAMTVPVPHVTVWAPAPEMDFIAVVIPAGTVSRHTSKMYMRSSPTVSQS